MVGQTCRSAFPPLRRSSAALPKIQNPEAARLPGFIFGRRDLIFYFTAPRVIFFTMTATRFQKIIALWLLAGVVTFAVAWHFDDAAGRALIVRNNPDLHSLAAFCSKLGEGWVVIVAGVVGAGVFLLLGSPQVAARIFFIAFTSSIAGLVATILRTLIGRTRPNNHAVEQGIYGVWHAGHWIIAQPAFSALPSGHAATAAGVAAAAWLVNRTAGALFAVYALAVMWSRIALECHHLSDVTASFFLAVILALVLRKHFAAANDIVFHRLAQKM
jgi:membrane-associated phospholipid phosphatase